MTLTFKIGDEVTVRYEGSLHSSRGTVTVRDEKWLTVELNDVTGPYSLVFGYDNDEGFWYDQDESGNWVEILPSDGNDEVPTEVTQA